MKKTVDEVKKMIMEDAPMVEIYDAIGYIDICSCFCLLYTAVDIQPVVFCGLLYADCRLDDFIDCHRKTSVHSI